MKIYIINLPENAPRRVHMKKQLAMAGFTEFEFVDGVRAAGIPRAELESRFNFQGPSGPMHGIITISEVGCALAHYSVWEKIAMQQSPCLVLEDDVEFLPGFKEWVEGLGNLFKKNIPWVVFATNNDAVLNPRNKIECIPTLYRPVVAWGGYCYLMHPSAAKKMTAMNPSTVADSWAWFEKRYGIEAYTGFGLPVKVNQDFDSDIGVHGWDKDWPFLKKVWVAMRSELVYSFWYPVVYRLFGKGRFIKPEEIV